MLTVKLFTVHSLSKVKSVFTQRFRATIAVIATTVVACSLMSGGVPSAASAAENPTLQVEQWRSIEISLTSSREYAEPLHDVSVTATFTGPNGATIVRPGFWDGGTTWRVRFAPTETGTWTMTTTSSDPVNDGLQGNEQQIEAVPYEGDLELYQHGFLRPDGHHLEHADGTPFFYLGDTHWALPHERFETSNADGVASQFRYVVDKRVEQGFTVFQSEPIWQPHGGEHEGPDEEAVADLADGFSEADLAGFDNLDRKFAYIADSGLVHANAMIDWALRPSEFPERYTPAYMADLARYWDARYGAYPVIWTVAQEIDKSMYGVYEGEKMAPWTAAIEALDAADDYHHPLMPHQENTDTTTVADSRFGGEAWHDGWATQLQWSDQWDVDVMETYWATDKPVLAYETPYEDFWTDGPHALSALYKSYLSGMRGYGYGISGLWNEVASAPGEPLDAGTEYELLDGDGNPTERYQWWYDAINDETGDQLALGAQFFRSLDWWALTPRFADEEWSDFGGTGNKMLATEGDETFVALFADSTSTTGTIRGLAPTYGYVARWFDPRTGESTVLDERVEAPDGSWQVPPKPSTEDWVLTLTKGDTLDGVTYRPQASQAGGDYEGMVELTLTSATPNAEIRYTTDGSEPTGESELYQEPIPVAGTGPVVVQAVATAPGHSTSAVMSFTYTQALTNLAQDATATASSNETAAPAVLDQDPSTSWQACAGCWQDEWIAIDLGAQTTFDTVLITEVDGRTIAADLQYRDDHGWHPLASDLAAFGETGRASVLSLPRSTAQQLRIRFEAGSGQAPAIREIGVFDQQAGHDLTVGGTYSASSSWDASQGAENAFDGSLTTNWQACNGCWADEWLEVDFGGPTTFDTIEVSEYGNRIRDYRFEYWTGSQWLVAFEGTGPFGTKFETTTVEFPEVTGTKLRMVFGSGIDNAPIVYELSAFHRGPIVTQPQAPTSPAATDTGEMSIHVSWEPATDGIVSNGYRVYEAGGTEVLCEVAAAVQDCTIDDLAWGSSHRYEVAAFNTAAESQRSAATAEVTLPRVPGNDGARAAPGRAVLSTDSGWDTGLHDGFFTVTMDLWWGENGSLFELRQDGELIHSAPLTMDTPTAQRASIEVAGLPNGAYEFTGVLVNSRGGTATTPVTVRVVDAAPGKPVLSHGAVSADGSYSVTADLWWGTNASAYRLMENGTEVAAGPLEARSPGAQHVEMPLTDRAPGAYEYVVEFSNAFGETSSAPLVMRVPD